MDIYYSLAIILFLLAAPKLLEYFVSYFLYLRQRRDKNSLASQVLAYRKELRTISQVDEFAKYSKVQRKLKAAEQQYENHVRRDLEIQLTYVSVASLPSLTLFWNLPIRRRESLQLRTIRHNMGSGRRVVCTGLGVISPLGVGARRSWSCLLNSKSGIVSLKKEHSFEGAQARIAAYVPEDQFKMELEQPKHAYMIKHSKQLSRATTYAMLAAHEALEESRLLNDAGQLIEEHRRRCGVAIGQGMVDFLDIYENGTLIANPETAKAGFRRMSPFFMTRALMNMSAGNVSIRYKSNGPNHCVSTACASGAHAIGDAFNFIRYNQADIMVCGSTEASINNIAMAGFERLKALSTKFNDKPAAGSRPFDEARCGFVMGEGAGVVILEEMQHALNRGLKSEDFLCEVVGYGTSADAHHLTAPAPDGLGASLCMRNALQDANLRPSDVSHINAHATSTPLGDDIECNAIEDLFCADGKEDLTLTSCKSAIGHLLGAAGSVETIFGILSCREGLQPPCLNLKDPLKTSRNLIKFVRDEPLKWHGKDKRILLKNSFGFGGTNASLIMSNVN